MPRLLPRTLARAGAITVLGALTLSPGLALAQDATPPAGEVVPGSECTLAPRPLGFLGQLVATPVTQQAPAALTAVPEGKPVDPATAKEIEATVRLIIACANSGDAMRALSLLSDDYLRRTIDPTGELDSETANKIAETLATPTVMQPDQLVSLIGIREMVLLPDGRVAVVVESDGGVTNPPGTDVDLFILQKTGDRWLIVDAVNDIDDLEAKSSGS